MYLGQTRRVTRRKPAKCKQCEEEIQVGQSCIVVVRNATSKKGKRYLWTIYLHLDCFLPWTITMQEKRAQYTAERKGGRPPGGVLRQFTEDNPELAKERHQCIRTRARLMRLLLAQSKGLTNPSQSQWGLVMRVKELDRRIEKILPIQVKLAGRRTAEDREKILRLMG